MHGGGNNLRFQKGPLSAHACGLTTATKIIARCYAVGKIYRDKVRVTVAWGKNCREESDMSDIVFAVTIRTSAVRQKFVAKSTAP